jgi:adenylate kinase
MSQINLVMFGAPGSGKGTQAKQMAEKFNLEHVSTGDLFRYEISHKTPLGLKAQEIINRGDLCPDDITLGMLRNHIEKHADSKGFIFDGVPRTIKQAEMLDDPTFFKSLDITKVIYLKVEMEEVQRRILKRAEIEQRADDTPATVKARVENFFAQTMPLVDYYRNQGKQYIQHDPEYIIRGSPFNKTLHQCRRVQASAVTASLSASSFVLESSRLLPFTPI